MRRNCKQYNTIENSIHNIDTFSVTAVIMQKTGAGMAWASSCIWDEETDGNCTVRWENDSMYCIVNVFGLAI